ncbi:MAG: STAS domain-containing protein [Spirochaetia bacterium]|nr:STAS domain-containing protein [Spirochaetia bacterium]
MELATRKKGKHLIVALVGELNLYNVGEVKAQITAAVGADTSSLVMDFKDLKYIDSSGIGLMAQLKKKYTAGSGQFGLMGVSKEVMDVLRITALDNFFVFFSSEEKLEG